MIAELKARIDNFSCKKLYGILVGYKDSDISSEIELLDEFRSIGSGDYDEWTVIFSYKDKTYAFYGYYDSHNGIEFYSDDVVEVVKKQTIINQWVPV